MQDSEILTDDTCLLCCEQRDVFILPRCNHKHICWKCCINMIKEGRFQCPFCKNSFHEKEMIIFVTLEQMLSYSYSDIFKTSKIQLLKSEKNSNFYYSNADVAQKIQYQTNYNCPFEECDDIFDSLNQLKKHLDIKHKRHYCDICLMNRKCIHSQQILYSDSQYQRHIKTGEFTENGDLILFHPTCDFCRQTFYDIDEFKRHLEQVHQKCYICIKNQELKYIYFKNYEQAVQHFKKSHFYCEIGTCMGTKFQNVFVSEEAMNDHIQIVHKKSKKGSKPIMNIELGFNKTQKEQAYIWDKVGKDFLSIFQMVQKHSTSLRLQPVAHEDLPIDIRDFYNEQSKKTLYLSLNKIKQKIEDKRYDLNYKERELYIDDIDFFRPLQMQPVSKVELQRFLHSIFDHKVANQMIDSFFTGKQNFKSMEAYFSFVKQKMRASSSVAFYYAFPQLVRFFKTQNPHKSAMDQYYYESLRNLKVKKPFIIHTKSRYSEIIFFMKQVIEKQMQERDEDSARNRKKQLDVQKYLTFLKDMNPTYYVQNQEEIFFVSKQKITNLYHMINKCRVQDFLKMNWLLKIGFNNEAYKIIYKEFYYKEQNQCSNSMKKLKIQQLAYLYAYCTICLEAIYEKQTFKKNKQKPFPLYFSEILTRIKKTSTHQRLSQMVQLEKRSLKIDHAIRQNKNKGIIINKQDHPSLLDRNIEILNKLKPPDQQKDFPVLASFGTIRPKIWNQTINGPSNTINKTQKVSQEDYPSILIKPGTQKKAKKKQEEQDFPIFHYVGKKDKKSKGLNTTVNLKSNFSNAIGWGNAAYVPNRWNQENALNQWQKRQQDQKRRKQRHQQIQSELNQPIQVKKNEQVKIQRTKIVDNFISNKTQKKAAQNIVQTINKKEPQQAMVIIKNKKSNKIDEQDNNLSFTQKKNKKNKKQQKQDSKQEKQKQTNFLNKQILEYESLQKAKNRDQQQGLFEKIEKQSEIISKKLKNQEIKLKNFMQSTQIPKKQEKQKIPSSYVQNIKSYCPFQKDDFPQLFVAKPKQKAEDPKNAPKKPVEILNKPEQGVVSKKKKRKMRLDDTDSEQQNSARNNQKGQHKKSQDFASISQKFTKNAEQKISKVNQIIQAAKPQDKVQNQIKVKKGRNGKKVIVQRVNLFNL